MTTETAKATSVEDELDKQIEVFEPVAKAVDRVLIHPETGEEKTFVQHEMGFLTKTKFFRLLSGTLRLAADTEGENPAKFIQEMFGEVVGPDGEIVVTDSDSTGSIFTAVMHLVELVPDFLEEAFLLVLNVRPKDHDFATSALENLDDDTGIEIIEVAIQQNGPAIKRFFDKHLRRLYETARREFGDTEQEQVETTP